MVARYPRQGSQQPLCQPQSQGGVPLSSSMQPSSDLKLLLLLNPNPIFTLTPVLQL